MRRALPSVVLVLSVACGGGPFTAAPSPDGSTEASTPAGATVCQACLAATCSMASSCTDDSSCIAAVMCAFSQACVGTDGGGEPCFDDCVKSENLTPREAANVDTDLTLIKSCLQAATCPVCGGP